MNSFKILSKLSLYSLLLPLALSPIAQASAESSPFGLPATAKENTSQIVGLPESTQWVSEKTGSFLYLTAARTSLQNSVIQVGDYSSNYSANSFSIPAVDYFTRFFTLQSIESKTLLSQISIWGRFGVGLTVQSGQVSSIQGDINSSAENSSLLIFQGKLGVLAGWDRFQWMKPYLGLQVIPYYFRNSSQISAAEQEGENFCYGPVMGTHLPLFFDGKGSILAEYQRWLPASGSGQLFAQANQWLFGLGLSF
jgi:hypothetical protein